MYSSLLLTPEAAKPAAQLRLNKAFLAEVEAHCEITLTEGQTNESYQVKPALRAMALNFNEISTLLLSFEKKLNKQLHGRDTPVGLELSYTNLQSLCLSVVKANGSVSVIGRIPRSVWRRPAIPTSAYLTRKQRDSYFHQHELFTLKALNTLAHKATRGLPFKVFSWLQVIQTNVRPYSLAHAVLEEMESHLAAIRDNRIDAMGLSFTEQAALAEAQKNMIESARVSTL